MTFHKLSTASLIAVGLLLSGVCIAAGGRYEPLIELVLKVVKKDGPIVKKVVGFEKGAKGIPPYTISQSAEQFMKPQYPRLSPTVPGGMTPPYKQPPVRPVVQPKSIPQPPASTVAKVAPIIGGVAVGATGQALWDRLNNEPGYKGENALYSIEYQITPSFWDKYMPEWIHRKPDIYLLIQVEGQGDYLIPTIRKRYAGQPTLEKLLAVEIPPGRKVLIHAYDDNSLSNQFWNDLLSQPVSYHMNAGASGSAEAMLKLIKVNFQANGSFKVEGTFRVISKPLELVKPRHICTAKFVTPKDFIAYEETGYLWWKKKERVSFQPWKADGEMTESDQLLGRVTFKQLNSRL